MYHPTSSSINTVYQAIKRKAQRQGGGIFMDITDTSISMSTLRTELIDNPIPELRELWLIRHVSNSGTYEFEVYEIWYF
ncbi:MAG: hypothetical protein ACFE0Q_15425 [Anaerolineae bacterium]